MPTRIDWADSTLNPLGWGCYGPQGTPDKPAPCGYCYAKRQASRNLRKCDLCNQFIPHWHPEQLEKPRKWKRPRKIFWQSMGDLMGGFTPKEQIEQCLAVMRETERHTHIILTKNPRRLAEFNPWPVNCWVGASATNALEADDAIEYLFSTKAKTKFLSVEPLLSWGNHYWELFHVNWLIVGAMTGAKSRPPEGNAVNQIYTDAFDNEIPVFMKSNLRPYWDGELRQEWPKGTNHAG